jgi:hypothetical protein
MPGRQSIALLKSIALGTLLQLIMVALGHFAPSVAGLFAEGGMAIAGLTGLLYLFGLGRQGFLRRSGPGRRGGRRPFRLPRDRGLAPPG